MTMSFVWNIFRIRALLAAAVVFAGIVPAPAAEPLGRLFLTPEVRTRLEALRQSKVSETAASQADAPEVEEPVASFLTVQGVVVRSGGRRTVFINGVPYTGQGAPKGTELAPGNLPAEVAIVLTEGAAAVQVKVGQSLDKNSLAIDDALLRAGTISIGRKAAKTPSANK
jgi:hypothetical protein